MRLSALAAVFAPAPKRTAEQIALDERRRVLRGERKAVLRIRRLYERASKGIAGDLDRLVKRIELAQQAGIAIGPDWLYRKARLLQLLRDIEQRISSFGAAVAVLATAGQSAAVQIAHAAASEQLRATVGGSFDRLPVQALESLAGRMSDGSPIRDRLLELGREAADRAEQTLFTGLAQGKNPRVVGKEIADSVELSRADATRIARTETMQAYRDAHLQTYKSAGVTKYRRLAARSSRTCAVCLALDGQIDDVENGFPVHPNCRCTCIPIVEGAELPPVEDPDVWLRKQPKETQEAILGKKGAELFRKGQTKLSDYVDVKEHPRYGKTLREKSLREVVASAPGGGGKPPGGPPKKAPGADDEGPDEISKKLFAGRKFTIGRIDEQTDAIYREVLGELGKAEFVEAIGAPTGSKVSITSSSEVRGLEVDVRHKPTGLDMVRTFYRDESGSLIARHDFIETNPKGEGTGTRVFAKAVQGYRKIGVARVDARATGARGHDFTGYRHWPKLGFNAPIPPDLAEQLRSDGFDAGDLHELILAYDEGYDWWKENGRTIDAAFDPAPGSKSDIILTRALANQGIRV